MAIGKAPGVTLLAPPYFLHQDSPVMDQLRSVKANLKSEFEEFCNHHDMSVCVRVCVWDCLRQGAQHMHGWARMLFSCTHRNVENEPRATVICQWLMSVTPPPSTTAGVGGASQHARVLMEHGHVRRVPVLRQARNRRPCQAQHVRQPPTSQGGMLGPLALALRTFTIA